MKCLNCESKLEKREVVYNINRKGYDVILRDVPALVCSECGETFYVEKSLEIIQELISDLDIKYKEVRNTPKVVSSTKLAVA